MAVNLKKNWNKMSESYQKEFGKMWGTRKFSSGAEDFLGNVRGKKIVELGCGAGQTSITLSKRGAACSGIDFSREQIEYGRFLAKKEKAKVNFVLGDLNNLDGRFPKNYFDIAFSIFAFQYIENLDRLFASVRKILKKNGLFVFSLDHPIWTSGEWKKIKGKEVFVLSDYFKRRKVFWSWEFHKGIKGNFYYYHKSFEDFFRNLTKNGFVVEDVVEPYPLGAKKPLVDTYSFNKIENTPPMIIFKCRKIN